MTVEKAIKILDWWIAHKKKVMERLRRKWDYSIYDEVEGIAETIFAMDRITIANLKKIRNELVPNCKHPNKMRDKDPNGQLYCTVCNFDL